MEIKVSSLNQSQISFSGLWGNKTYMKDLVHFDSYLEFHQGLPVPIELNEIDKFYPFADDTKELIEKEIKEGFKKGVKDADGAMRPFAEIGKVKVQKSLPFTRSEYLAYKAKECKGIKLTGAEKDIEHIFDRMMMGLSSYKNKKTMPKCTTLVSKIKVVLQKIVK